MPAFLAAGLLCLSPVFFAQSLMAQLDMPAMLFTTLALWLFLRGRIPAAAIACTALVLVKETGVVAPLVFAVWLAYERRWRDAAWFLTPVAALGGWIAILYRATGHWTGSPGIRRLQPVLSIASDALRLQRAAPHLLSVLRQSALDRRFRHSLRLAHQRAFSEAATGESPEPSPWRTWWYVTALGGATLERYLLPVLPVLYAAMTAGLFLFPEESHGSFVPPPLAAGLIAGIFVNPPYPFPYENNLAFADFVHLQAQAADYLRALISGRAHHHSLADDGELARPEDRLRRTADGLGFLARPGPGNPGARELAKSAGAGGVFAAMGPAAQSAALRPAAQSMGLVVRERPMGDGRGTRGRRCRFPPPSTGSATGSGWTFT